MRRWKVWAGFLIFLMVLDCARIVAQGALEMTLPPPLQQTGVDIMVALSLRKSVRQFQRREIPPEMLSTILWAAYGVNRPDGKRTIPTPHDSRFLRLYVLNSGGVFVYEAASQKLLFKDGKDMRRELGLPEQTSTAPLLLLSTAQMDRLESEESHDQKVSYAFVSAGCLAQNVYLISAALKLGACYTAVMAPDKVIRGLSLKEGEIPLGFLLVGFPENVR